MATNYGVGHTKLVASPREYLTPDNLHGRMRIAYDKFTLTADLALNDVIKMGKLPKGARVVGYWLKSDDLSAASGTLDLGYAASSDGVEAADDNAFLAAVDVTSATTKGHTDQANMVGLGKKFSAEVDIEVKVHADTDATSGSIETCIMYVVD